MTRSPQFSLEGGTLVITMDDGRANVIHADWNAAFSDALTRAEQDDVTAVILQGRPKFFSAGLDVRSLPTLPRESCESVVADYVSVVVRLAMLPKPVVAAVDGHAMAGGAIVLLAADRKLVSAGSWRIGLTEMSIGVPLPDLALSLARLHLSPKAYQRALLEGGAYDPHAAHEAGYVDEVVPAEALATRARELASQLGSLDTTAYGLTKRRLRKQILTYNIDAFAQEISGYLGQMSPR